MSLSDTTMQLSQDVVPLGTFQISDTVLTHATTRDRVSPPHSITHLERLQLTESAKGVVREALICSFIGDLRELPPTKGPRVA